MRRKRLKSLNVEVRMGSYIREAGYRRLKWYIKGPQFQRYLPM
jgi:hypothetical protein